MVGDELTCFESESHVEVHNIITLIFPPPPHKVSLVVTEPWVCSDGVMLLLHICGCHKWITP